MSVCLHAVNIANTVIIRDKNKSWLVGVVYVSTVYHLSRINEEKILNIFDIFSVERSIKG